MIKFFKSTMTFAFVMTTVLTASAFVAPAQAAGTVVPPPPPRGDASNAPGGVVVSDPNSEVVHDRTGCFSYNDALERLVGEKRAAGYINTYKPRYYDNNTKLQLFGVKAGDQWYAFIYDMCKARIIEEGKLKGGKPGFIDDLTNIGG
jgi:hypothetical protein